MAGDKYFSSQRRGMLLCVFIFVNALYGQSPNVTCASITKTWNTDQNWLESTVVTPNVDRGFWKGVSSLPDDTTFSLSADTGSSYAWSTPVVPGTYNLQAPNNVSYFRRVIQIDTAQHKGLRFESYFDDNIEVYLNGTRLFRQEESDTSTFYGVPHQISFYAYQPTVNGGPNYDSFDVVEPVDIAQLLKDGNNEITVVVRNFQGAINKGGFSMRIELISPKNWVNTLPADTLACRGGTTNLNAAVSDSSASLRWYTQSGKILSGGFGYTPLVSKPGWYILELNDSSGCKYYDSVLVYREQCIIPLIPPADSGKTRKLIGAELNSLFMNPTLNDSLGYVFVRTPDSVYIEIISIIGKEQQLLSLLTSAPYGLTNIINTGQSSLIITGKFPVANLGKLNNLPQLINYVRPLYPPLVNRGAATTGGDRAMRSDFIRKGFAVEGEGVRIGLLSDGFNTLGQAGVDEVNGDLPSPSNPNYKTPVKVLQEYPFGQATDEGRAMLQIIHDMAPAAELVFRTGFISAGDMAQGIYELMNDSCDIIVDDITYITEPFLEDGQISNAVDSVVNNGVSYFTSAGNFDTRSHAQFFNPASPPASLSGDAHDFGGGDIFQNISLPPGSYTIVLQWQDPIYSLGQTGMGTQNDLDIYLSTDLGQTLFGFNRDNTDGDPLEVLSFTVTDTSETNILITRASGNQNVYFKYVVFRGDMQVLEYQQNSSTVVGHANAKNAISVGAVLYTNTPEFGNSPSIASFSSRGGTLTNGISRAKPDLSAANGGNTTVEFGAEDLENDGLPNFFGTSAAAPHAAAVGALIQSAYLKFDSLKINPSQLRNALIDACLDFGPIGFDLEGGAGLLQGDSALLKIANPTPFLSNLEILDTHLTAGTDTIDIALNGEFLTTDTRILLLNDTLDCQYISSERLVAQLPPFIGNPPLLAYNPAITSSQLDGGFSDTLRVFMQTQRRVDIVLDNQSKLFSEQIPELGFTVLVDSLPLDSTNLNLADLGLDSVFTASTTADSRSEVGIYVISGNINLPAPANSFLDSLGNLYNYQVSSAILTVEPMPLVITARDTTMLEGDSLPDLTFSFNYPDSLVSLNDKIFFDQFLDSNYENSMADAIALVNAVSARGRALVNADFRNLSYGVSGKALVNARPLVNGLGDSLNVIDIPLESIYDYQVSPDSAVLRNAIPLVNAKALVNAIPLINGIALVNAIPLINAIPLVNGIPLINAIPLINGTAVPVDSGEIVVILDEDDLDSTGLLPNFSISPVILLSGLNTGENIIVPAPFINRNYSLSYQTGILNIVPLRDSVYIKSDTSWRRSSFHTFTGSNQYPWPGAGGLLPAASSYVLPVVIGQPYPWVSIAPQGSASVISAESGIRFFKKDFNLYNTDNAHLTFTGFMDDGIELFINGTALFREDDRSASNFRGVPHQIKISSDSSLQNPVTGFQGFDISLTQLPANVLQAGNNEMVIALRNAGGNDKGGMTFEINLITSPDSAINKNSITNSVDQSMVQLYPNPTTGVIMLHSSPEHTGMDIQLFGASSSQLGHWHLETGNEVKELSLEHLPAGVYWLRISSKAGQEVRKIIKM